MAKAFTPAQVARMAQKQAEKRARIDAYKANIRLAYDAASVEWLARGANWYAIAQAEVCALADKVGMAHDTAIAIVAILSANSTWPQNIVNFGRVLDCIRRGDDCENQSPAIHNTITMRKVAAVLNGENPAIVMDNFGKGSDSYKVKRFYANLSGQYNVATMDRWMARICLNEYLDATVSTPSGNLYLEMEVALYEVAQELGIMVAILQAMLWTAILKEKGIIA